ncbi:helix-turn-helix domain-containing protein [Pseudonocardia halophobica]|uniref:DNA-binding transcriptional regulator, PucR family n=1 Tax=Pseudonocardia halophobica TaxID=29401 RepID=A0A9W6NZR5_9PSEU|nr:helix-turn-helix domain-containing protein [Pseudonocardia halophobica]GLL15177.1 hypothetical protein GCM10017577_63260 [Pseudonocardia halophobica]
MTSAEPGREWLCGLGPRGRVTLAESACLPTTVAEGVSRVGELPVCWAVELGREMATRITREIPPFGGGDAPFEMLRRGTESSVQRALLLLAQPSAGLSPTTEESLEGIREFVRRSISLDRVLRGIRLGHADMAQAFLRSCETLVESARLADEMKAVTDELFRYVDGFADAMTREYLAEYDRWTTSAAAARAETVRAVLAGEPVDVTAASRALGYELERRHLGLTVWTDAVAADSALQLAAADLLRARGATATLVVPVGSGQLWAWGAVPRDERPLSGRRPGNGVRAAFGVPATGIDGFRRTHREAVRAAQLRRLSGDRHGPVTDYADVAPAALLGTDLIAAGEFVRRELGALAERSEPMGVLRTTLLHYLDAERSLVTVAGALHVARGTVAYRVKRAEQLLGREVAEHRFALHAALLLAEEIGDAVLDPDPDEL